MRSATPVVGRLSAVLLALALVFCAWYAPLQQQSEAEVDSGLRRSLVTFASARAINGLISVAQGTELSAQPLGVGVTLTVGQILDPVNDLVEQFSSLMLFASVAFGVQKLLLTLGGHPAVSTAVSIAALAWAALALTGRSHPWLNRLVLVLLMIRLAMPFATLGSALLFDAVMADDYAHSQRVLQSATRQLDAATPRPDTVRPETAPSAPAPASAAGGSVERQVERLRRGVDEVKSSIGSHLPDIDVEAIRRATEELPERMVRLIVIFLMQTVALPLLLVWALYALAAGLGWSLRMPARPRE